MYDIFRWCIMFNPINIKGLPRSSLKPMKDDADNPFGNR